jgi:hypothetical protein
MSATEATTKPRRRRGNRKPSKPSSSDSSVDESDTGGDVQYAFLARAQVYGEIPEFQDGNEGEVFDLYARNTKNADKQVEIMVEKTEDTSHTLSEMTAAELQEHIGSLHQLLTPPVFDMAEPSEPPQEEDEPPPLEEDSDDDVDRLAGTAYEPTKGDVRDRAGSPVAQSYGYQESDEWNQLDAFWQDPDKRFARTIREPIYGVRDMVVMRQEVWMALDPETQLL